MPSRFTQVLDTVSPSYQPTEKVYDNSLPMAAEAVANLVQGLGEQKAQRDELASASNFSQDINEADSQIEALRDQSDLLRLQNREQLNTALQGIDPLSEEATAVRARFAADLERISLREQQQGIILEANRRALVRKWQNIRPDMTDYFQKTLGLNKALREFDEGGAGVDKMFQQYQTVEQEAIARGIPIGSLIAEKTLAANATNLQQKNLVRAERGKLAQPDFDATVGTQVRTVFQSVWNEDIMPLVRRAMQGDAQAVIAYKAALGNLRVQLDNYAVMSKAQWQKDIPDVQLSDEYVRSYVNGLVSSYENLITTGDVRNFVDIAKMQEDDVMAMLWGAYIPWLHPKIAAQVGPAMLKAGLDTMSTWSRQLTDPRVGFSRMYQAAQMGNPDMLAAMTYMRVTAGQVAAALQGSPMAQDAEAVQVLNAYVDRMTSGAPISEELATLVSPLLAQLFDTAIRDPNLSDPERKEARDALVENTMRTFDNGWSTGDILNANSPGNRVIRGMSDADYEKAWEPVGRKIGRDIAAVGETGKYVLFFPESDAVPFRLDYTGLARDTGRSDTDTPIGNLIDKLNKGFQARMVQRGRADAIRWANEVMGILTPQGEAPATSNNTQQPSELEAAIDEAIFQ